MHWAGRGKGEKSERRQRDYGGGKTGGRRRTTLLTRQIEIVSKGGEREGEFTELAEGRWVEKRVRR